MILFFTPLVLTDILDYLNEMVMLLIFNFTLPIRDHAITVENHGQWSDHTLITGVITPITHC